MINAYPMEEFSVCLVIFKEHPFINYLLSEPGIFDICAKGSSVSADFMGEDQSFSMLDYCIQLMRKLVLLQPDEFSAFLDYHCGLVKDGASWLGSLEKLLQFNTGFFVAGKAIGKLSHWLKTIEHKRNSILQMNYSYTFHPAEPFGSPVYSFHLLKKELDNLETFEEKITMLLTRKAEYFQNEPLFIHKNQKPYNELVDLEIKKLYQIEEIGKRKQANEEDKGKVTAGEMKLRFNGQLNVLVDIFYQMRNNLNARGLPYLNTSIQEITDWIVRHFLDKEGKGISPSTVRTILSPNRPEKRPKQDDRLMIKKEQ